MFEYNKLSDFQKFFYNAWYKLPNDVKQTIQFKQFDKKQSPLCIERLPGKFRRFSSIDNSIKYIEIDGIGKLNLSKNGLIKETKHEFVKTCMKLFDGYEFDFTENDKQLLIRKSPYIGWGR